MDKVGEGILCAAIEEECLYVYFREIGGTIRLNRAHGVRSQLRYFWRGIRLTKIRIEINQSTES